MAAMTMFQGDSSDVVSVGVYAAGVKVTDLTGYAGRLTVVKKLGDLPLVDKAMTVVGSDFRASITPAESAALALGSYLIVTEIENNGLGFKRENHTLLTVNKQGYVP